MTLQFHFRLHQQTKDIKILQFIQSLKNGTSIIQAAGYRDQRNFSWVQARCGPHLNSYPRGDDEADIPDEQLT